MKQEMDRLEDATATLMKKLDVLDTRLELICHKLEPLEVKTAPNVIEDKVSMASVLGTFGDRIDASSDRIDSILERLEL